MLIFFGNLTLHRGSRLFPSCLWWNHEMEIRSKGDRPSVLAKGKACQNNIHLSQEDFWGQHKLLLPSSKLWMPLASSPTRLDLLSTAEAKSPALCKAQHQLLVLVLTQFVGDESICPANGEKQLKHWSKGNMKTSDSPGFGSGCPLLVLELLYL